MINNEMVEDWREAIEAEMRSLQRHEAYVEIKRGNQKVLETRWVLTTKISPEGHKKKAQFLIQGNKQISGLEFLDTFSPALCKESLRFFVSLISSRDMVAVQMDISSAFLPSDVDRESYIELPFVFYTKGSREKNIGLHKRSKYGLKQTPRLWKKFFDEKFISFGFKKSDVDPCLYFAVEKECLSIVAVYVDEVVLESDIEINV
jgi:Reverse transcriptase (RNA-dependent DNA polymerase)